MNKSMIAVILLLVAILFTTMGIMVGVNTLVSDRVTRVTEVHHIYHIRSYYGDLTFPDSTDITDGDEYGN
ncbi:MAG TPA: hypothetical protein VMV86_02940 [Methanosarcinales archaeon]|nr:hypothetical protein [Methanosarcinales archaeon]